MGPSKSKSATIDVETTQNTTQTTPETQRNENDKSFWERLWEFITFSTFSTPGTPNLENSSSAAENPQNSILLVDGTNSVKTKKKLKHKKEKLKGDDHQKSDKSCLAIVHDEKKKNGNKLVTLEADSQTPKPLEDKITSTSSLLKFWRKPKQLTKSEKISDNKEIVDIYTDKGKFEEDSSKSSTTTLSRRLVYLWPPWGSKESKSDTDAVVKIHKLQLKEPDKDPSKASTSKSGNAVKLPAPTVHRAAKIKFSPKVSLVAFDNTDTVASDDEKECFRELVKKERKELLLVDTSDEWVPTKVARKSRRNFIQSHVKKTVKKANLELFKSEDLQFES